MKISSRQILWLAGAAILFAATKSFADTVFVYDLDGNGSETVVLIGSNSYDADGALIDFQWKVNGTVASSGFGPTVGNFTHDFTLGYSTVTLSVRDDVQVSSMATIGVVVLSSYTNRPPVANAIVPSTASAFGGLAAEIFVDASSSHDPDNDPVNRYVWLDSTTVLFDGPSATATITLNGTGTHPLTLKVYSTDPVFNITQSGSRNFSTEVFSVPFDPTKLIDRHWTRSFGKDFSFGNVYGDFAAITFNPLSQTYFMTDNKMDKLFELREDGSLVRMIDIAGLQNVAVSTTADAEGITWIRGNTYALALRFQKEMAVVTIYSTTTAIGRPDATIYSLSGPGKPRGIAYSASEDAFYWVVKNTPMAVIKSRINPATGNLDTIWTKIVDNLPAGDLSDIAVFPDLSPHLFLVSEGTAVVMEVDLNGPTPELFSVFSLKPWPIPRANGLTTNQLGQIVIVGKHAANTPEDDFNVFIPVDGPSPSGNLPILPSGSPPISINWIHPGGAQQAEFFINLNETGSGEIFIYDQNGREVHSFRTPEFPPGQYRAPWDLINDQGTHVASGVYFVLIKTPDSMRKEKLVIVR